jgi:hypothetical protein
MVRYRKTHSEAHDWLREIWPHYQVWTYDFGYLLDDLEIEIFSTATE